MSGILDTVLLLALPASGKSEVRRYLALLSPEECANDFHMGPTVQLDDYPYVHLMRRIDDELEAMGKGRIFFKSASQPFKSTHDWATLIHLVNEDYFDLRDKRTIDTPSAAEWLFARIDAASAQAGLPARLDDLDADTRAALGDKIEAEARALIDDKQAAYPDSLEGKTLVIEFARGGPEGTTPPLPEGYGYQNSLPHLAPELLEKASVLYIWVTPEESRRKNEARADPNDPGSILNHGVPIEVMLGDYGTDDMTWLEGQSEKPGTLTVRAHGRTWHLPVARVDNRQDKTTFIRSDRAEWKPEEVEAIHTEIKQALDTLYALRK